MSDCTDVQALERISNEVDESQIKITLSSQCIKAQAYLVDKLRKQSERQKEICVFISNSNSKLEDEIKQAEHEINSLIVAIETIGSSNIEFKKELLLAKENKSEIEERVKTGERKYEHLWLESKARYESLPLVQVLIDRRNKGQTLQDNINALHNQAQKLISDTESKKKDYANLDRERIIQLANFFVIDVPKTLSIIREKSVAITVLEKELEEILKEQKEKKNEVLSRTVQVTQRAISLEKPIIPLDDNWQNLYANIKDSLPMPKLQLDNTEFDALSATLDQIKLKKVEILQTTPLKRTDSITKRDVSATKKRKNEENIPYLFNAPVKDNENCRPGSFSKRKLINILEDIKLDKNEGYDIVSNLTIEKLKNVTIIGAATSENEQRIGTRIESEEIEEIDLTNTNNYENLAVPPTQFLDTPKNSQEDPKKKVSFDLPSPAEATQAEVGIDQTDVNKTASSELNTSAASDEGYARIKDMIFKKHHLDSSPQFVYAANTTLIKTRNDDKVVTSKFFIQDIPPLYIENNEEDRNVTIQGSTENIEKQIEVQDNVDKDNICTGENVTISSSQNKEIKKVERPVTGFLFSHGTHLIPDSLDVSLNTTCFEEGEPDFPHCIDSSLLLSPKADVPMSAGNPEVLSQEVPNFLSGLRKTGLSLFGMSTNCEDNIENNLQSTSNSFNFNFGGEEKKNRGGLFSMFT